MGDDLAAAPTQFDRLQQQGRFVDRTTDGLLRVWFNDLAYVPRDQIARWPCLVVHPGHVFWSDDVTDYQNGYPTHPVISRAEQMRSVADRCQRVRDPDELRGDQIELAHRMGRYHIRGRTATRIYLCDHALMGSFGDLQIPMVEVADTGVIWSDNTPLDGRPAFPLDPLGRRPGLGSGGPVRRFLDWIHSR